MKGRFLNLNVYPSFSNLRVKLNQWHRAGLFHLVLANCDQMKSTMHHIPQVFQFDFFLHLFFFFFFFAISCEFVKYFVIYQIRLINHCLINFLIKESLFTLSESETFIPKYQINTTREETQAQLVINWFRKILREKYTLAWDDGWWWEHMIINFVESINSILKKKIWNLSICIPVKSTYIRCNILFN